MGRSLNVVGVEEVRALLGQVDRLSASVLTKAAKAGANIALKDAKANCPISDDGQPYGKYPHMSGNLKKNLRLKLEKRKKNTKRVYTVGAKADGWYSHFVDYGHWATGSKRLSENAAIRDTQTSGMTWVPGNRFLRNSIDNNRATINQTILTVLATELSRLR